ncbi:hypothetical protein [Mesorhizobium sp. M7A.F.Ca.US.008.03.1.1]|uniref:hypothetical protein n=1 Tax=Mesorhizobium sp. M7A.F.Ca.US.008.03.1.1 TaxID=2496742 RepID=UPI001FE02BE1|nr:hypothetical protein [Mesorhizobium sp. M7A.F.Ca.US.008.03.1.1]
MTRASAETGRLCLVNVNSTSFTQQSANAWDARGLAQLGLAPWGGKPDALKPLQAAGLVDDLAVYPLPPRRRAVQDGYQVAAPMLLWRRSPLSAVENTANNDFLRTHTTDDDVLAMDELMGPAFIGPAHTRIVAEELKHCVEFAQVLFGLSVAEVFEGVAVCP